MSRTDEAVYAGVGTAELRESPSTDVGEDRTEPFTIHGVALGVGDVTLGQSETRKRWPADELREAAHTLTGQPLVRDHRNTTEGKIGEVTHAEFVDELGIIYEAEIAPHYEQLAKDIRAGLMEVSVRAYHAPEEELESESDGGPLVVEDIYFDNLSVVNDGASPSNTARSGPVDNHPAVASASEAVSVGTVSNGPSVATLERSVDMEQEAGLSMTSDDTPDDDYPAGPVAEDDEEYEQLSDVPGVYEADGTMFAVAPDEHSDEYTDHADDAKYPLTSCTGDQSIESAWNLRGHGDYDIDESTLEKRILDAAKAMDCDLELVGMDEEENRAPISKGVTFFDDQNNTLLTVESVDNRTVTVSADDGDQWNEYMDAIFEKLANEEWRVASGRLLSPRMTFFSTLNDTRVVITDVTDQMITVRPVDSEDTWTESRNDVLTKLASKQWEYSGMAENSASLADAQTPYTPEEGDWVEWQVNPDMFGQVVHNPEKSHTVMVEVYTGGKYDGTSTGHTVTAGYADVVSYEEDSEEMHSVAEQTGNKAEFTDTDIGMTELADSYSQGDWVRWDTRNSTEIGKVTGTYEDGDDLPSFRGSRGLSPEGDEVLLGLRMYKERDGTYHPIEGDVIGHYADNVRSADAPSSVSDSTVELGRSNHDSYSVEEESWVQWYPSDTTEEHGWATDVDGGEVTIEKWEQNSDGEWKEAGNTVTKDMEAVEPWGNFPRKQDDFAKSLEDGDPRKHQAKGPERREGSDENPDGSAASENSAASLEDIEFSDQVEQGLKNKLEEHNEEYGDEEGKKLTLRTLKAVYRRGAGAYSDSHREGMTRQQWSYARVNAFLYLVRNGQPENDAYTQDNDLLPDGHPKAGETGDSDPDSDSDSEENASSREQSHSQRAILAGTAEAASMDELDEVYSEWDDAVNMTASELDEWADHPCASKASVDPDAVLERNLELLETNKSDWTADHIEDAKRTISFIARMSDSANEPDEPRDGPSGCPSEWAISLLNWAYNPFDSLPEVPDELAETEQMSESHDELANDMGPDHKHVFESKEDAKTTAERMGLDGMCHEMEFDGDTYYVPGEDHDEYMSAMDDMSGHEGDMDDESEDDESDEEESESDEMSAQIPVASLTAGTSTDTADTTTSRNMTEIDYEPASAENLSADVEEPVVVERDDLEDLSEKAQSAEDVEAELGSLTERLDEQDEAREVVDELSDEERELIESDTDATVVEASAAEMFDEVQRIYAEELADYAPFSADELADRFSPTELKDRVEDHEEANLSSSIEDADVDPDGGSDSAEELSGEGGEDDVREKMAEELESAGWHDQAEKVRAGEIDPVRSE